MFLKINLKSVKFEEIRGIILRLRVFIAGGKQMNKRIYFQKGVGLWLMVLLASTSFLIWSSPPLFARDYQILYDLRVDGNVGVGTTTAAEHLHLKADDGTDVAVKKADGNVGIGTTAPSAKLTLDKGGFLQTISSNPTLVASVTNANMLATEGIYISGKYAYVTSYNSKALTIIDITVPTAPTVVGSLVDETCMYGASWVHVSGKYAYVTAKNSKSLTVVDISNPASPTKAGSLIDTTNLNSPTHVYVAGKYAYITAASGDALTIVDISDPTNPVLTYCLVDNTLLDKAESVQVRGKYAYVVAESANTLCVIDISNPASPSIIGSVTNANLGSPESVAVSGKYAYVAGEVGNCLSVVNISTPTAPSYVTTLTDSTYLYNPETVYVAGKYAYVVGHGDKNDAAYTGDYLTIVDISDPTSPSIAGSIAGSGNLEIPYAVSVSGKYAYVASQGSNTSGWTGALSVIDVFGIDAPSASIGDIAANTIEVADNLQVANMGYFDNGINVGQRGVFTDGSIIATGSSDNYLVGNVGIGSTAPTEALDVVGNIAASGTITGAGMTAGGNITMSDDEWVGLGASAGRIVFNDLGTDGIGIMNGNVGIGLTSPSYPLHVNGAVRSANISVDDTTGYVGTGTGANTRILFENAGSMRFKTGGSERLTITTGGNVGIGTTAPDALLDVVATSGTFGAITLHEAGIAVAELVDYGSASDVGGLQLYDEGVETIRLRADSAASYINTGNLGVGTTAPSALLHARGSSPSIFIDDSGGSQSNLRFYTSGTERVNLRGNSAGELLIQTGGPAPSTNVVIDSSGNVGIGTTNPTEKLYISSDDSDIDCLTASDTASSSLHFLRARNTVASPAKVENADNIFNLEGMAYDGVDYLNSCGGIQLLVDGETGTNDVPTALRFITTPDGSPSGNVRMIIKNTGNVGIGTAGPRVKLDVNGPILTEGGTYVSTDTQTDVAVVSQYGDYYYVENTAGNLRRLIGIDTNSAGNIDVGQAGTTLIGSISLRAGNAGYIRLVPGGGEAVRVISNGNVGINDTTPSYKLDVAGSIRATGTIYGDLAQGTITPSGFTEGSVVFAGSGGTLAQDNAQFFWDDSNNRLGIGTTGSAAALHVVGSGSIAGSDIANGHLLVGNDGLGIGIDTNEIYIEGNNLNIGTIANYDIFFSPNSSMAVTIKGGGNVGIGTTTPEAELDIYGSTPTVRILTDGGTNGSLQLGSSSVLVKLYSQSGHAYLNAQSTADLHLGTASYTQAISIDNTNGKVGIGSTVPTKTLDIVGDIRVSNAFEVGGAGDLYIAHDLYFSNGVTAPRITSNKALSIISGAPASNSDLTLQGRGTGKVYIDDNLEVTGTISGSGTITTTMLDADLQDLADGSLTGSKVGTGINASNITSGTLADARLETTLDRTIFKASDYITAEGGIHVGGTSDPGTDKLIVDGNVGIGTTAPAAKLEIKGTDTRFRLTDTTYSWDLETGSAGQTFKIRDVPNNRDVIELGTAGHIKLSTVGTERLRIDTSGNVGIGTTAPGASLHTYRSGSGSHTHIKIENADASATGAAYWELLHRDDGNFDISGEGTERFSIDNTGNLGIGTVAPVSKLNLEGDSADFIITQADQAYSANLGSTSGGLGQLILYNNDISDIDIKLIAGTGDSYINAGNVGIGSTAPLYDLDVVGDIKASGTIYGDLAQGTVTPTGFTQGSVAFAGSGGTLAQDNAQFFWDDTNNRLGIGTVSPTSKLHVYGSGSTYGHIESGADNQAAIRYETQSYNWTTGIHGGESGKFKISNSNILGTNDYVTISTSGNVGIGTTGPIQDLHITDDDSSAGIYIDAQAAAGKVSDLQLRLGTSYYGLIRADYDNQNDLFVGAVEDLYLVGDSDNSGSTASIKFAFNDSVIDSVNTPVMKIQEDGNVGIGTTAPVKDLHVIGEMNIVPDNAAVGLTIDQNNSAIGLRIDNEVNVALAITGGATGVDLATFTRDVGGSGAIGIHSGSSDPQISFRGGSNTFSLGTEGTSFKIADNAAVGTNDRFTITSSGNVGIGTTAPNTKLTVTGSTDIASSLRVGSAGTPTDALDVDGNADISGNLDVSSGIDLLGGNIVFGNPGIGSERHFEWSLTNDGAYMYAKEVTSDNTDYVFKLRDNNAGDRFVWWIDEHRGSSYDKYPIVMAGNYINFQEGNMYLQESSGNVGINDTSPSYKLDVAGSIRATGTIYGDLAQGTVTPTGFTQGSVAFAGSGGTLAQDNANLFWDDTNNRLGIGTTGPSYELDVSGAINGSNLRIANSGGPISPSIYLGGSSNSGFSGSASGGINFILGGSNKMHIKSDGNVGIGTTAPNVKLHVEGSTLIDAFNAGNETGIFFREGYTAGSKYNLSILARDYSGNPDGLSINAYGGIGFNTGANDSSGERVRILANGNVGIGTTAPLDELDVNGDIRINGVLRSLGNISLRAVDGSNVTWTGGVLYAEHLTKSLGDSSHRWSAVYAGAGDFSSNLGVAGNLVVSGSGPHHFTTGNLGIGTTAPGSDLHIFGAGTQKLFLEESGSSQYSIEAGTDLNIADDGTSRIYLKADGNVGIGTTAPSAKLTLDKGGFLQTISSDPTVVGSVTHASMLGTEGVYISGKYAYVTSYNGKALTIIDITVPTAPTVVGSLIDDACMYGASWVHVAGKYAYVTAKVRKAFTVVDISNPASPTKVGSLIDTTNLNSPTHVYVAGRYAYVTSASGDSLTIIDISDPTNPVLAYCLVDNTLLDKPESVHVRGKYAYVAAETANTLCVIDISNPTSPSIIGSVTNANLGSPESLYVCGKYAYVAGEVGNCLSVVNISTPTAPSYVTTLTDSTYLYNPETVYVSGKYAYVVGHGDKNDEAYTGDYLTIVDISDPTSPTIAGSIAGSGNLEIPYAVSVSGKYAYVASQGSNTSGWTGALTVIDVFGIDAPSASIGDIAANTIEVADNLQVTNMGYFDNGINVGQRGVFTDGSIIATGSSDNYLVGNLGIGSTVPTEALDVVGNIAASGTITGAGMTAGGNITMADDEWVGLGASAGRIVFNDLGTDALGIMSGNLGIGTAEPLVKLDIEDSSTTDVEILRISSNGTSGAVVGKTYLGLSHWHTGTNPSTRIGAEEVNTGDYDANLVFQTRNSDSDSVPSTRMIIQSDGNVGIGATAPGQKLEVAGTGKVGLRLNALGGSDADSYIVFREDNEADNWSIGLDDEATNKFFITNGVGVDGGANAKLTVQGDGNVGIGVTDPDQALEVVDTGGIVAHFTSSDNDDVFLELDNQNTADWRVGHSNDVFQIRADSSSLVSVLTSGNVGIGTAVPNEKLDLNGDLYLRGDDLYMSHDGGTNTNNDYLSYGDGSVLGSDGVFSFFADQARGGTWSSPSAAITAKGAYFSGNVGINDTTPSYKLDVAGSIRATGTIYGDLAQGTVTPTGFTEGSVAFAGSGGTLAQDNSNFFWDDTNNRLGIGTTNPSKLLELYGANATLNLRTDGGSNSKLSIGSSVSILELYSSSGAGYIKGGVGGTGDLFLGTNSYSQAVTIDGSSGNVGIGTTAPANKLELGGANDHIYFSGTAGGGEEGIVYKDSGGVPRFGFWFPGSDVVAISNRASNGIVSIRANTATVGPGGEVVAAEFQDDKVVFPNGNVGIGTTAPSKTLHVDAGIVDTIAAFQSDTKARITIDDGNDVAWIVNDNTKLGLGFGSELSTSELVIQNNGNVGIGTIAPANKFEVKDTARAEKMILVHPTQLSNLHASAPLAALHIRTEAGTTPGIYTAWTPMDFSYPVGENFQLGEWDGTTFTERFRVSGTVAGQEGYVGIADTGPDSMLEVSASGEDDDLFMLSSNDDTNGDLMIVKNSGNIGIGTTTPSHKLHIKNDLSGDGVVPFIHLDPNSTTQSDAAAIDFRVSSDDTANRYIARIAGIRSSSAGSELAFSVESGTGFSEAMRVDDTGNVGINDTTPSYKLDVAGSIRATGTIYGDLAQGTVTPTGFTQGSVAFAGSGGTLAQDNSNFFWDDTNNRLGIGTTAPTEKLSIEDGNIKLNAAYGLLIKYEDNLRHYFRNPSGTSELNIGTETGAGYIALDTGSGVEAMRIDSTGNVGIGTIAPGAVLDIQGSGATTRFRVTNVASPTTGPYFLSHVDGFSNSTGIFRFEDDRTTHTSANKIFVFDYAETSEGQAFTIQRAGAEQVVIKPNGNVGIGSTAPLYKLDIVGEARCQKVYTYGTDIAEIVPLSGPEDWFSQAKEIFDSKLGNSEITSSLAALAPRNDTGLEGVVVSLDRENPGQVKICSQAYDSAVAGVISTDPGNVLGSELNGEKIALVGKVPVWVDTSYGAIEVGDLLVASATPGCAMRADPERVQPGVVIGKAMEPADKSQKVCKIDAWVNLQ